LRWNRLWLRLQLRLDLRLGSTMGFGWITTSSPRRKRLPAPPAD
jgi:hypothetical protein